MSGLDAVYSSHPVFHAFKKQIYFFEAVNKINRHGISQPRHLVIHTSGVFLLKMKTFQRSFSIARVIPFYSLNSMIITSEAIKLIGSKCEFAFTHRKHLKIAARIYSMRIYLFDHQDLPFNSDIDPKVRDVFDGQIPSFSCDHLLADRFLACVLSLKCNFDEDMLSGTYDMLTQINSEAIVSVSTVNSPFMPAICIAIAYGFEVSVLTIEGFDISVFRQYLSQLFKANSSIRKIVFKNMSFNNNMSEFEHFFSGPHTLRVTDLLFDSCRFTSPDTGIFFDSFSQFDTEIKTLQYTRCTMTRVTLDSIFQSLFFSTCFHSLEQLILSDVTFSEDLNVCIFQLLCCGWVLSKRCLKSLSLRHCNLDIGVLLTRLQTIDCGVLSLDVGRNYFSSPFGNLGLHSLAHLILDGCTFSGKTLHTFFQYLAEEPGQAPLHVDLSCINIPPESLQSFYSEVAGIKISRLKGLVWDGNAISGKSMEDFVLFMKDQPNLNNLSLSRCIPKDDLQKALPYLTELARFKKFEQFCIASTKESQFGVPLVSMIEAMLKRSRLRVLDITNQGIGDFGLHLILRESGPYLEELWFEGFSPSTHESFITICTSIMGLPSLRKASWPASDARNIQSKLSNDTKSDVYRRITQLRHDFQSRFGDSNIETDLSGENLFKTKLNTSYLFNSSPTPVSTPSVQIIEGLVSENIEAEKDYFMADEETQKLLTECKDVVGCRPILSLISKIQDQTTIRHLLTEKK